MFEIIPAFAVPIIHARLDDSAELNKALRELFLQREHIGDEYANKSPFVNRNDALYESRFDLFAWPETCIQQLKDFCWRQLYRAVGDLNSYSVEELKLLHVAADAWFHVTRKGGYFGLHNHPMASWSGVYCVDAGQSDGNTAGVLSFVNPFATNTMFIDMASARMRKPYSYSHREYRLTPGELVIFPSWLLHQVLPYGGEGERITVAFNAWFKWDGPTPTNLAPKS